jgi:hypothetical protein
MSPDLIAFLKAWHDWATSGAPDGEPFWRKHGLCGSAKRFAKTEDAADTLWEDFAETFWEGAELEVIYPFGVSDYRRRLKSATQHECPKRLAWVRERLIEAGELVA